VKRANYNQVTLWQLALAHHVKRANYNQVTLWQLALAPILLHQPIFD